VPITLLVHKETGELHPRTAELIEAGRPAHRAAKGIDAWFELTPADLLGEDEGARLRQGHDTLDVWFDSGVTHACVLEHASRLGRPADLYLEGSDQHRGWFQSSLLTSVAMHGRAPYKQVLTHGFTVDQQGRKMSKSLGNVVKPAGRDEDPGRRHHPALGRGDRLPRRDGRLRRDPQAHRRCLPAHPQHRALPARQPQRLRPGAHLVPPGGDDRARPLGRRPRAAIAAGDRAAYQDYQFHLIYHRIHNFCVVDMGGFYLDVIKDRQYTTQADSLPRRSCQTAMYHIVEAMSRWLAPILSFTADEIWQHIPGERSASAAGTGARMWAACGASGLCGRCVTNVDGPGEERRFA
jgi:isoleucyl-tRNA synthetase